MILFPLHKEATRYKGYVYKFKGKVFKNLFGNLFQIFQN